MTNQNILNQNEDRLWLVKSANAILGPFTIPELAQNVRNKTIGLLDEARTPYARWIFIRDIPEIQSTISKLAQQEDTFEKTHTAAATSVTVTRNTSDENTPIPLQIPIIKSTSASTSKNPSNPQLDQKSSVKSYSIKPSSTPIQWGKWSMVTLAVATFIVAFFSFIQKRTWEAEQKKIWLEFQQLYVAQLYEDAYKKLKQFEKKIPDQATALTRAGFLYLNPGRELVLARRMFEKSTQLEPNNRDLMIQNLNGLGLVDLYEGQATQAKANFDHALTLEPGNILTRFNLISLYINQSQWSDAYALAEQVAVSEPKKAAIVQAALSVLSSAHTDHGREVVSVLSKSIDSSAYLRPIIRLMMIKLVSLDKEAPNLGLLIKEFFDDLPSFQVIFVENPLIDQRWRDWNFLYQFCSDIKGPTALEAEILAVKVVCVSEIKKWNEAERIVAEGLKRFPNNISILLAQLHMLTLMERWPDVRAIMKTTPLTSNKALNWMFAKACFEENNKSCADLYIKPLMQNNQISTAIYQLQAQILCSTEKTDSCRFAVTQGLNQDPATYELLKIRFNIESGQ